MRKDEKELFKALCSFKAEEFDETLLKAATPVVLGQLFFNRMQSVAYGILSEHGLLGKVNREFRNRVKETLVFAENDERLGTQLVLNIVGDFSHTREVKELCMSCLPAYQVPTKINLLPELPKNGSGKIIRRHKNG